MREICNMGEIFKRTVPPKALEWTGERLTTATAGQVEIEHLHRYFIARELCRDLDVLDVASGEGYGSALLAQVARSVVGVELEEDAVAHAAKAYVAPNLRYQQGDARNLPLDNASVDVVVSFETIEHFYEHEVFMEEVRRVLRPSGRLIISSPEPSVYSPMGSPANPYHVRELSRNEFEKLMRATFQHTYVLAQRPMLGSTLIADNGSTPSNILTFERRGDNYYEASRGLVRPPYIVAVASDEVIPEVPNSLFIETSEIGDVLARAAQSRRAEAAEAALAEARNELQQRFPGGATLYDSIEQASRNCDQLRLDLERTHAELLSAVRQRDLLRQSFVRREGKIADLQNEARTLRSKLDLLQQEVEKLRRRAAASKAEAADWKRRYHGLRARLEAILRRFGVLQTARLVPHPLRRFVRERLLGPASSQ